ncbi:3-hydroxyacyl-CoA dehydrogenase NAD-binding domain-containing protein [Ramlibacter sp.]|uniref:3-hydroxyacyl-CoA dehydrogenase NAD-binding domain-containing protein n=1 Tax=Ramlibacter sp. TaxID=1917967 RepID=UPI003D11D3FB
MQAPIRYERDAEGIVTLTFDAPGAAVNTMTEAMRECLLQSVQELAATRDTIVGVILTSAKETFFAGGDLNKLYTAGESEARALFDSTMRLKAALRQLETLGKPVVAALNGTALGGGFEIALACHHRIAVDKPKALFGLPEAGLGLMPGAGGVVRLPRLLGLAASQPYMQEGTTLSPGAALEAGFVHALCATHEHLLARARDWIRANPSASQPWDRKDFALPGGRLDSPPVKRWLSESAAQVRAKTRGRYPAPEAILAASVEGLRVEVETAAAVEARYFVKVVTGQVAKNIIGTFWFRANEIKSGAQRPADVMRKSVRSVAVLGAGMMGRGIAYAAATRGIDAWVKDATVEDARKAVGAAEALLAKRVEKGEFDEARARDIVARIHPVESYGELAHVDLVVEAVPENPKLKADVTAALEPLLGPQAMWGSNTSTLPITGLAAASTRPHRFIGLHFFSPVHRMPLVEVIKGAATSKETLAHALDFVMQLGKTPIVVNDSRGFFTSRVFSTFTREGAALLGEGQQPGTIESAAVLAGFSVGPLAVLDEVSLALSLNNRRETTRAFLAEGRKVMPHAGDDVLAKMVDELGRKGRAAGGGFYDYQGKGKAFWPGLAEHFLKPAAQIPFEDVQDRLLFCMALEATRALEDGVIDHTGDGNVGSVMGIGFPRWTGGVFQFLNQYGLAAAVERAERLAARYGERFEPPERLRDHARRGVAL